MCNIFHHEKFRLLRKEKNTKVLFFSCFKNEGTPKFPDEKLKHKRRIF